jgi:hypothetical protein
MAPLMNLLSEDVTLWADGGGKVKQAALVIHTDGQTFAVLTVEVEQGQIQAIRIIANPEKLARV